MRTYYIERNNKLTGERGISRIDAQSLSMALYIAESMHGSLFTYKLLALKALQNVRRPQ